VTGTGRGVGAAEESGARRVLMAGVVRGGGSRRRLRTGSMENGCRNPIRITMDFTMRFDPSEENKRFFSSKHTLLFY
jgi:hypothetical protein